MGIYHTARNTAHTAMVEPIKNYERQGTVILGKFRFQSGAKRV